jgi:hypothetical protein
MNNKEDKRIGKKALGHTPHCKWGRKKANKKSRSVAKKELHNV